jgi:ankyrin repeat protein
MLLVDSYFNNPLHSDVVFIFAGGQAQKTEKQVIYGHKLVLSLRSEAFRITFEKDTPRTSKFSVKDVSYDIFVAMVRFIYTDKFQGEGKSIDFCMNLLAASAKFRVIELAKICTSAVVAQLELANILHVLSRTDEDWTRKMSDGALRAKCMAFLTDLNKEAFGALVQSPLLKEMNPTTVAQILKCREDEDALLNAVRLQLGNVVGVLIAEYQKEKQSGHTGKAGESVHLGPLETRLPLKEALRSGNLDIVKQLVAGSGGKITSTEGLIDRSDESGDTLLHVAAEQNDCEHLKILLDAFCGSEKTSRPGGEGDSGNQIADLDEVVGGEDRHSGNQFAIPDINAQNNSGRTPIHVACDVGNEDAIELLLDYGAVPNMQDNNGNTALHVCAGSKSIQLLLGRRQASGKRLASLEIPNNKGRTPLHEVCLRGDVLAMSALLEGGALWDATDDNGNMPIHLAALNPVSTAVVLLLVQKGEELHPEPIRDSEDNFSLSSFSTIKADDICATPPEDEHAKEMAKIIHKQNDSGDTPLHIAASSADSHHNGVKVLLAILENYGRPSLEVRNGNGDTPLHKLAAHTSSTAALEQFAANGANLNVKSDNGDTPLHRACRFNNHKIALALVEKACPPNRPNKDGKVAIDFCTTALTVEMMQTIKHQPTYRDVPQGKKCMDCGVMFGVKWRPHHCRHCGRPVCNACSLQRTSIPKFNEPNPVRVCTLCFDVLCNGAMLTLSSKAVTSYQRDISGAQTINRQRNNSLSDGYPAAKPATPAKKEKQKRRSLGDTHARVYDSSQSFNGVSEADKMAFASQSFHGVSEADKMAFVPAAYESQSFCGMNDVQVNNAYLDDGASFMSLPVTSSRSKPGKRISGGMFDDMVRNTEGGYPMALNNNRDRTGSF